MPTNILFIPSWVPLAVFLSIIVITALMGLSGFNKMLFWGINCIVWMLISIIIAFCIDWTELAKKWYDVTKYVDASDANRLIRPFIIFVLWIVFLLLFSFIIALPIYIKCWKPHFLNIAKKKEKRAIKEDENKLEVIPRKEVKVPNSNDPTLKIILEQKHKKSDLLKIKTTKMQKLLGMLTFPCMILPFNCLFTGMTMEVSTNLVLLQNKDKGYSFLYKGINGINKMFGTNLLDISTCADGVLGMINNNVKNEYIAFNTTDKTYYMSSDNNIKVATEWGNNVFPTNEDRFPTVDNLDISQKNLDAIFSQPTITLPSTSSIVTNQPIYWSAPGSSLDIHQTFYFFSPPDGPTPNNNCEFSFGGHISPVPLSVVYPETTPEWQPTDFDGGTLWYLDLPSNVNTHIYSNCEFSYSSTWPNDSTSSINCEYVYSPNTWHENNYSKFFSCDEWIRIDDDKYICPGWLPYTPGTEFSENVYNLSSIGITYIYSSISQIPEGFPETNFPYFALTDLNKFNSSDRKITINCPCFDMLKIAANFNYNVFKEKLEEIFYEKAASNIIYKNLSSQISSVNLDESKIEDINKYCSILSLITNHLTPITVEEWNEMKTTCPGYSSSEEEESSLYRYLNEFNILDPTNNSTTFMQEFDQYAEEGKLYIFDSSHGINYSSLPLGKVYVDIPSSGGGSGGDFEIYVGQSLLSSSETNSWTLPIPNLSIDTDTVLEKVKIPADLGEKCEELFINLFSSYSSESNTNLAKTLYKLICDPTLKVG